MLEYDADRGQELAPRARKVGAVTVLATRVDGRRRRTSTLTSNSCFYRPK
jgi:hypothetical protein